MTGLTDLHRQPLTPYHEELMRELTSTSQGSPIWRARKRSELRELLALSQIAPRLRVLAVEMETELRAFLALRVPVPCLAPGEEELSIADSARIVVRYPKDLMHRPFPGYELIQILAPTNVLHPNVSPSRADAEGRATSSQLLCLGARVLRNYPLRELVLQTYSALCLQAISLDRMDPQGVMNPAAVSYWNARTDSIPLTTEPFLAEVKA